MSEITTKFYNIFWQNKACQNLFLLSKEEFLDRDIIPNGNKQTIVAYPRLILSNNSKSEFDRQQVQNRRTNTEIELSNNLENKISGYVTLIENLYEGKLQKEIEAVINAIEKRPFKFSRSLLIAFANGNSDKLLTILKDFKIVKPHIKSMDELEDFYKKLFDKYYKQLINDSTVRTFNESIRKIKDQYTNYLHKKLVESNQITVDALSSFDNFKSRLELFELLYESNIIGSSEEDGFIECPECDPGTFYGSVKIKLKPRRTKKLICPACSAKLTYFIPYKLNGEIFKIVNSKDGLLLNALENLFDSNGIKYESNKIFGKDIEIDTCFEYNNCLHIIEVKMFKSENTTPRKLKQKVKQALSKLNKDTSEISTLDTKFQQILPILLVNIQNDSLISEIETELDDEKLKAIPILNISNFESKVFR